MSDKKKKGMTGSRLLVVYSLILFLIIFVILSLTTLVGYLLTRLGIVSETFYLNPLVGVVFVVLVSFIIALLSSIANKHVILRPIQDMTTAMKELEQGNFDAHIDLDWGLRPQEMVDFSESFNQTAKELRSVKMLRSDFINNFSHEFKTPIVSLRGFAELLKHKDLSEEKRQEYLDIIIAEASRLTALSTNVLTLTKIENQAILTDLDLFAMDEQIRQAILVLEPRWSEKALQLDVNLQEVVYFGNTDLMSQVWVNLLDNAIKFSEVAGKLEIELTDFSDEVLFTLKDYGCGMDADTKARVFDKFFQADDSKVMGGNGLGMTIVQKIITLHRGHIAIESEPGEGTLVTVSLPKQARMKKPTS
ncbi:MAG: HAMP domain-containing histidine kinase [Anaerolineaceae bacterium]|nr:HAMP domain-containing histidine kinase [Anaerolineaceae bacterium]